MAKKKKKRAAASGDVATNRRARHKFDLGGEDGGRDRAAGLRGEVAAPGQGADERCLRGGRGRARSGCATCTSRPTRPASSENHEPERPRKLLLHRAEIERLIGKTAQKGLTLIPTRIYFKGGGRRSSWRWPAARRAGTGGARSPSATSAARWSASSRGGCAERPGKIGAKPRLRFLLCGRCVQGFGDDAQPSCPARLRRRARHRSRPRSRRPGRGSSGDRLDRGGNPRELHRRRPGLHRRQHRVHRRGSARGDPPAADRDDADPLRRQGEAGEGQGRGGRRTARRRPAASRRGRNPGRGGEPDEPGRAKAPGARAEAGRPRPAAPPARRGGQAPQGGEAAAEGRGRQAARRPPRR